MLNVCKRRVLRYESDILPIF